MMCKMGRLSRNLILGFGVTALMMASSAASAQTPDSTVANKILPGVTSEEIISILTENKIQAQKAPLPGNDPLIFALSPSGAKFFVRLQGCGENGTNCQVIQYGAIFTGADLPASDFNTFNGRYAFGKAYIDDQKQIFILHAVTVAGGIRRAAVEVNMFVFFGMADRFVQFLSQRMNTVSASLDKSADKKSGTITNKGVNLPANSTLASFREAVTKHPEIINKVDKGGLSGWKTK